MVFGNMVNVTRLTAEYPQSPIFAMRISKSVQALDISARTGIKPDEVKRFNPALGARVPAQANLYLPLLRAAVRTRRLVLAVVHRRRNMQAALNDFLRIDGGIARWHEASFETTLRTFQDRFEATRTEEGSIMATTLAYVISDLRTSRRAAILEDFRTSGRILDLFKRGVEELGLTINGQ
jgi:hypothetical protein